MRIIKKLLPVIVILAAIIFTYSFFHIDGREIKFLDKLPEAETVHVIIMNDGSNEEAEFDLSRKQIEKLKNLIEQNSYTRRISSTIIGVLPEKRYTFLANWDDNGQKHLYISLLGGEYINVLGEFGGHYHKIKNPDFEKELNAIFGDK